VRVGEGASLWRFGHAAGSEMERHDHAAVWERQEPARLVIAASRGGVDLMLDLARVLEGPFRILYVLVVPRGERAAGRYETPELDRADVERLLVRFRAFLETDGRHHLWLASPDEEALLVFDRHDILYAYGPIEAYEARLAYRGFHPGALEIPVPHLHAYHVENDADARDLAEAAAWTWSPLQDPDED
jgi:hypothetical protein